MRLIKERFAIVNDFLTLKSTFVQTYHFSRLIMNRYGFVIRISQTNANFISVFVHKLEKNTKQFVTTTFPLVTHSFLKIFVSSLFYADSHSPLIANSIETIVALNFRRTSLTMTPLFTPLLFCFVTCTLSYPFSVFSTFSPIFSLSNELFSFHRMNRWLMNACITGGLTRQNKNHFNWKRAAGKFKSRVRGPFYPSKNETQPKEQLSNVKWRRFIISWTQCSLLIFCLVFPLQYCLS